MEYLWIWIRAILCTGVILVVVYVCLYWLARWLAGDSDDLTGTGLP